MYYQDPYRQADSADSVGFMLSFSSNSVTVKEEAFIYPLPSFVAEVGGSLGLFLGFSFLGIWDWVVCGATLLYNKYSKRH